MTISVPLKLDVTDTVRAEDVGLHGLARARLLLATDVLRRALRGFLGDGRRALLALWRLLLGLAVGCGEKERGRRRQQGEADDHRAAMAPQMHQAPPALSE
jgi:hypothetical protein